MARTRQSPSPAKKTAGERKKNMKSSSKRKKQVHIRRCCVCDEVISKVMSGFSFPIKDPVRCKQWAIAVGMRTPKNRNFMICERHFEANCISAKAKHRKNLLKTAMPTLNLIVKHERGSSSDEEEDVSDETEIDDVDDDDEVVESPPTPPPAKKRGRKPKIATPPQKKDEDDGQQKLLALIAEKDRDIKSLEGRVDELEIEIKALKKKVNKSAPAEPIVMPFKKRFVLL